MHSSVSTFWNFWPFSIVIITILRVPLNLLFLPIYVLTFIPQLLWNLLPEQISILFEYILLGLYFISCFISVVGIPIFIITSPFIVFIFFNVHTLPSILISWIIGPTLLFSLILLLITGIIPFNPFYEEYEDAEEKKEYEGEYRSPILT